MNAIFVKQVSAAVLKGKYIELTRTYINNECYVIQINISSNVAKCIDKNILNQNMSVIKESEKFSWINNILGKLKINRFKNELRKIIKANKLATYSVIYSNALKKNKTIKEYMNTLFNEFSINEYVNKSTIEENMNRYIEEYIMKNNLKCENIKPLIIVDDVEKLNFDIVKQLNEKYKEVNIFSCNKIRRNFANKINKINDEYGSCIGMLNKNEKDFRKYNICIFVDRARTEYTRYRFNNKSCYIDFTNKENDRFNTKYLLLEKGIKDNKYFAAKVRELYELYGKITVANTIIN